MSVVLTQSSNSVVAEFVSIPPCARILKNPAAWLGHNCGYVFAMLIPWAMQLPEVIPRTPRHSPRGCLVSQSLSEARYAEPFACSCVLAATRQHRHFDDGRGTNLVRRMLETLETTMLPAAEATLIDQSLDAFPSERRNRDLFGHENLNPLMDHDRSESLVRWLRF